MLFSFFPSYLGRKKSEMKKWILLALLAVSCSKDPLFPGRPRFTTEAGRGKRRPHSEGAASSGIPDGVHLYATAVRFNRGYDWQSDTVPSGGEEQIILLKDGEEILSIPAGGSASPERHRVRDGQLWTDRSIDGRTIVSRNGVELFSWTPEESLKGFLIRDGDVYTLGQRIGGKGISLRCNGKVVFELPSGTILGEVNDSGWESGALMTDGEEFCFCYRQDVRAGEQLLSEYRFVKGGRQVNTVPAGSVLNLYDWRIVGGIQYRSEMRSDGHYLVAGGKDNCIRKKVSHIGKLLPWKEQVVAYGYFDSPFQIWADAPEYVILSTRSGAGAVCMYSDGNTLAYVNTDKSGRVASLSSKIVPTGDIFSTGNYHFMSPCCGDYRSGCFAVALTNLDSTEHLLCIDDTVASFNFNGYFTSVRIE